MDIDIPKRAILSVTQLTRQIKSLLEEHFPFVWITGEISNFRKPMSGHYYFTLKDERSQISAVMFRGQNRSLKFKPEDGMTINGFGRIGLYEPRGSYQIILEYLEPGGIGALQLAFEQLKEKLSQEGLFDERHKNAVPFLPRHITVITSASGAVLHDIRHIVSRRFANLPLMLIPVKVQGDGSVEDIVNAIQDLNRYGESDVAILARGGGSLEDLAAFNSEAVARAIFNSRIPIVSAVGHETDYTIADFTADLRAPTPSAAAERVAPLKTDLLASIMETRKTLMSSFVNYLRTRRTDLRHLRQQLMDPRRRIQDLKLRLDDLTARLVSITRRFVDLHRERTTWRTEKLYSHHPGRTIVKHKQQLDRLNNNLLLSIKIHYNFVESRYQQALSRLNTLSPLAVLQRGYSITRTLDDRRVIRDAATVKPDDVVEILLARGRLRANIRESEVGDQGSEVGDQGSEV